MSLSKGSFKQKSARVANPLAMKPRRGINVNITSIMPNRGVASKFTDESKPAGMTNGMLQFSFRNTTELPGKQAGSISNNARVRVESPPKVVDIGSKER